MWRRARCDRRLFPIDARIFSQCKMLALCSHSQCQSALKEDWHWEKYQGHNPWLLLLEMPVSAWVTLACRDSSITSAPTGTVPVMGDHLRTFDGCLKVDCHSAYRLLYQKQRYHSWRAFWHLLVKLYTACHKTTLLIDLSTAQLHWMLSALEASTWAAMLVCGCSTVHLNWSSCSIALWWYKHRSFSFTFSFFLFHTQKGWITNLPLQGWALKIVLTMQKTPSTSSLYTIQWCSFSHTCWKEQLQPPRYCVGNRISPRPPVVLQ